LYVVERRGQQNASLLKYCYKGFVSYTNVGMTLIIYLKTIEHKGSTELFK